MSASARRGAAGSSISKKRFVPRYALNTMPSIRPWRLSNATFTDWAADGWYNKNQPTGWTKMIGQAHVDTDVAMMARLCKDPRNFRVRFEIPWRLIETAAGTYDWSMLDYIVNVLNGYGFVPHAIIWCTPAWQGAGNSLPTAASFQSFCSAVATRYKNKVYIYEAWNEPLEGNGHYLYAAANNTNGQAYVTNLLNPCYTAIKAVDPTAIVECAGTGDSPANTVTWITNIASGTAPTFDAMGFHDYPGASNILGSDYNTVWTQFHTTFASKANGTLWIDEVGVKDGGATNGSAPTGAAASWFQALFPSPQSARNVEPATMAWYTVRDEYVCGAGPQTWAPESSLATALVAGASVTAITIPANFGGTIASGAPISVVMIDNIVAVDTFNRTVSNSWGTAEAGQAWSTAITTPVAGAAAFNISSGQAKLTVDPNTVYYFLKSVLVRDVDVVCKITPPALTTAFVDGGIMLRYNSGTNDCYQLSAFQATTNNSGNLTVQLKRKPANTTILADVNTIIPGGVAFWLRFQAFGVKPTTLRWKIWQDGFSEPGGWNATTTDSTANMQYPGGVGVEGFINGGSATVGFNSFKAIDLVYPNPTIHRQDFLLNGAYTTGTSIPVVAQNANFSFPIGAQVLLPADTARNPEAYGVFTREGYTKGTAPGDNASVFYSFTP